MASTDYIPQGRLGSHQHGKKLLQIQTEFAHRPRPRLTTSVVLDGRTVHKTDRDWADDLTLEENRIRLDADLKKQHEAIMGLVAQRAADFVEEVKPVPVQSTHDTNLQADIRDTMEEVLRTCPYVLALYEFDAEGEVVFRCSFRDVVAEWDREFAALSGLVFGLPEIIRVGQFRHGIVEFGAENLIAACIQGRAFGILTDPEGTSDRLQHDFPEFFEAVSDAGYPV